MEAYQENMEGVIKSGQEGMKATLRTRRKYGGCDKHHLIQTGRDHRKSGGRLLVICKSKETELPRGHSGHIEGTSGGRSTFVDGIRGET
jgi:hypothetical protein